MASGDDLRLRRFVHSLYYGALQRDPTAQELGAKSNELAAAGAQGQPQLLQKAKDVACSLPPDQLRDVAFGRRADGDFRPPVPPRGPRAGATAAEMQQWRDTLNAAAAQGADAVVAAAETLGRELFAAQVSDLTLPAGQQPNPLRERWATYERDDETGLDYAQARYYSSSAGRFTSPDEFEGGPV